MRGIVFCTIIALTMNAVSTELQGEESSEDPSWCTREVLMTFFPEPVVRTVLVEHGISRTQAAQVAKGLATKDSDILQRIEMKSAKMQTQPYIDMSQREAAVQLFKETLYEVF